MPDMEEKKAIAQYGPPMVCPECGYDVFKVTTSHEEEVKLFWDGDSLVPHFVCDRGCEAPEDAMCRKCGAFHSLSSLEPDEVQEEE